MSSEPNEKLILALPKGRILEQAAPLFARAGIEPEAAFADPEARQLRFTTNHADIDIIRVRSFDVATFVAFGAAHLGIAGADVLMEFDYPEIYAPIDLGIGHCRLAVALSPQALVNRGEIEKHPKRLLSLALKIAKDVVDSLAANPHGGKKVSRRLLRENGLAESLPQVGDDAGRLSGNCCRGKILD